MKRIALLLFVSSPAFSHTVPFNEPEYLAIDKDPAKAHAVKMFCEGKGLGAGGCKDAFGGKGNFAVEAVAKCEIDAVKRHLKGFVMNPKDLEQRAHKVFGDVYHKNVIDGHAHTFSQAARETGANRAFNERLTEINNKNNSFQGAESKTSGHSMSGGFEAGVPGAFSVNFDFGGNQSTTISVSKITPDQIKELTKSWLNGWNNPDLFGAQPTVVVGPDGKVLASTSSSPPAPEKTEKDVKTTTKKEDEKKGAENPPKHEDNTSPDIPDLESTSGGSMMAGESDLDVSGIATPVMDAELAPKSGLERCVEKETMRLMDELGSKTIDPNKVGIEDERKQSAEELLKRGYCQESYYGREFCAKENFKRDSVVAIDIKTEREEAAKGAMDTFKMTGRCDPNALGKDFCKKARDKILINPVIKDPTFSSPKPRTIKPGDIPSIHNPE